MLISHGIVLYPTLSFILVFYQAHIWELVDLNKFAPKESVNKYFLPNHRISLKINLYIVL